MFSFLKKKSLSSIAIHCLQIYAYHVDSIFKFVFFKNVNLSPQALLHNLSEVQGRIFLNYNSAPGELGMKELVLSKKVSMWNVL